MAGGQLTIVFDVLDLHAEDVAYVVDISVVLRYGIGEVDLIEQTPLAPDIGDCPTFAVPQSNLSAYKVTRSLPFRCSDLLVCTTLFWSRWF